MERRATRASTRNGGGNGRARVDGRDATRTKIYAAEDGSRPVGKKRERGGDDATTRGDGGDGKKKKKKKRMYNRAFAEVMKRRNMGASAADAAKEKEKEKEKKEKKKKSRAPPTAPRASAAVEEKASEKASEKTTTSKASKGYRYFEANALSVNPEAKTVRCRGSDHTFQSEEDLAMSQKWKEFDLEYDYLEKRGTER